MARPDFRAAAARRLSEEGALPPTIVSLLSPEHTHRNKGVRVVPIERIEPNPQNPRMAFNEEALQEMAASIREHGVLQPVLVRPSKNVGSSPSTLRSRLSLRRIALMTLTRLLSPFIA